MRHSNGLAAARSDALTVAEAAALLGIDRYFVEKAAENNQIAVASRDPLLLDQDSVRAYGVGMRREQACMARLSALLEEERIAAEEAGLYG